MKRVAMGVMVLAACGGAPTIPTPTSTPTSTSTSTPTPTPTPTPPAPAPAPLCAADMVAVADFCIDRYEAPNEKGQLPYALRTAYDGEAWCAARGKRLCTEEEWTRACEGSHARRYPYGDTYREGACNDGRPWKPVRWSALARWPAGEAREEGERLFQGEPSGARAACVSEEGVHDLTGNVAEWVRRAGPPPHPGWVHVLKGCYWAGCYHQPHPDCAFTNHAHPGTFRTYEAGFRCCSGRASGLPSAP